MLPLNRHSTLPELQDLVGLFHPEEIYPNTMYDQKGYLDYFMLSRSFDGLVSVGGLKKVTEEATRLALLKQDAPIDTSKTSMRTAELNFPTSSFAEPNLSSLNFGVAEAKLLDNPSDDQVDDDGIRGPMAFVDNLSILCGSVTFADLHESIINEAEEAEGSDGQHGPVLKAVQPPVKDELPKPNRIVSSPRQEIIQAFKRPALPQHTRFSQGSCQLSQRPVSRPARSRLVEAKPSPAKRASNPSHHSLCKCNEATWPEKGTRSVAALRKAVRTVRSHQQVLLAHANLAGQLAILLQEEQNRYEVLQQADAARLLTSPATSSFHTVRHSATPVARNLAKNMSSISAGEHINAHVMSTPP